MTIRCKFKCSEVKLTKAGGEVILEPVTSGSPENEEYFQFTPYGKLTFGLIKTETAQRFLPEQEYYLDITPV